jgi:hypothetical protein
MNNKLEVEPPSLGLYILINCIFIWSLKILTPIFFAIFIYLIFDFNWESSWLNYILFIYSSIEIIFYFKFQIKLHRSQIRNNIPHTSPERRLEIWNTIINSYPSSECPYNFLNSWFGTDKLQDIGYNSIKKWLAWALYNRNIEELTLDNIEEIENMINVVEKEKNFKFNNHDYNFDVMHLTCDPVKAYHKPFIYYIATGLMDHASDLTLKNYVGFERLNVKKLSYWIKKHNYITGEKVKPPLVFIHGIGIGLITYLPFILKMSKLKRTIILIELPHVSMKINFDGIPTMNELTNNIDNILKIHSYNKAFFVAHSLGTFVYAAINRIKPDIIDGVLLIDPVCFQLWVPTLTRNFCYRTPVTPMQIIQNYHISRDIGISYYFHRHFWWHECMLLSNKLPENSTIFVSEHDDIYDTNIVRKELSFNNINTHVFYKQGHGAWILDSNNTSIILESLK